MTTALLSVLSPASRPAGGGRGPGIGIVRGRGPTPVSGVSWRIVAGFAWASLAALGGGGAGLPPAGAQRPLPPPAVETLGTRVDTGVRGFVDTTMQRGRQEFAAYTTPMLCLAAIRSATGLAHRAATDSTGAHYRPEDTLPSAVVAVARRCGTRFTVDNVAPTALLEFAALALLRGDDATAHVAAERYVAAAPDLERRRWALYAVDTLYLHARPMRRAAAEAVTLRLDSLGAAAALQRKLAYEWLLEDARQRYDVERLHREVLALLTACHQQRARDSLDVAGGSCSEASLVVELFFTELYRDPQTALARTRQLVSGTGFSDWKSFDGVMHGTRLDWVVAQSGQPVPPLVAPHWVGPKGRAPGWPVRGKVSIVLRGNLVVDAPKTMARWKRLAEEFRDALDITILVPTRGYFQAGGARSGPPLSPTAEAERVGQFYREELGLPVTVALVETPVEQLPPPDGRILRGTPPLDKDPYYAAPYLLADREGKLLMGWVIGEEPQVHAWVARAIRR